MHIKMNADDMRIMQDGVGKKFGVFVDSLIRASASKAGIPAIHVHTNIRGTVPDGGIDAEVDRGGSDPEHRLSDPSVWQYKAKRFADVVKNNDVYGDILGPSKQEMRYRIASGFAYRYCICDDTSVSQKKQLQAKLNLYLKQVRPDAKEGLVLLASDLADWANSYPAVVAAAKAIAMDKFLLFKAWKGMMTSATPHFVPTQHFHALRNDVEAYLQWPQTPAGPLTVFGDAGVGKTRSLFEALNQDPNLAALVLYTRDEQAAISTAIALNNSGQSAILVADECQAKTRYQLAELLRGAEDRIRLITIDNARERVRSVSPALQVQRSSENETLAILNANFDGVPPERKRRYASLASGFVRFAIFMCQHDADIQSSGDLTSALSDASSYYENLFSGTFGFDEKDRQALEIVSLSERVGAVGDVAEELKVLCEIAGKEFDDTLRRIERIHRTMGLVANAGYYYYVTPTIVAMIAFESAWNRWIRPNPYAFISRIPESLVDSFQIRVSRAPKEVGAEVAKFFRQWALQTGPRIFATESDTRRLAALVVSNPETETPILRSLVDQATPEQLGPKRAEVLPFGASFAPRRVLVSISEELAQFEEFFSDAEAILFKLAMNETEPSLGNNATKTWQGLFRILLSGTEVSFQQRCKMLLDHFTDGDASAKLLVVAACGSAVDQHPIRMVGPPMFGRRIVPDEWSPHSQQEYFDAVEQCVALLRLATFDTATDVSDAAQEATLSAVSQLLWARVIVPVQTALSPGVPEQLRPRLAAVVRDSYALLKSGNGPVASEDQLSALERWLATLKSTTLHERLIENVGTAPWSHHFEESDWRIRMRDIAEELVREQPAFEAEIHWLCSAEAKAAADLGQLIGALDGRDLQLLDRIVESAIRYGADGLARGYLFGASQYQNVDSGKLNQAIDKIQAHNPRLAFFIMLPAGDLVSSFRRALQMVRAGEISARLLANLTVWVGNRKTTPLEAVQAIRLLLPEAKDGNAEASDVAIDFAAYQINRENPDAKLKLLGEMFGPKLDDLWELLQATAANPGRETFWTINLLQTVAPADPLRAISITCDMVLGDSYLLKQEAEKLLQDFARKYPSRTMEIVGSRMLDENRNAAFFVDKLGIFYTLPLETVVNWLDGAGVAGARAIARHLPPPFLNETGTPVVPPLTEFVLSRFESDDRTFNEFNAGVHSFQLYVGSFAEARRREEQVATQFLSNPLRRIRQWAELEAKRAKIDAEKHGRDEQEFGIR